jgi:thiamine-phosphate pyrophosphorylase
MFPDVTPAVNRAAEAARQWACRLGADSVRPVHLLLGLLEEAEGRAATLLAAATLDPARARQLLTRGAAAGQAEDRPLPLHAASRQVWTEARSLAAEVTGERTVASESLLLAVLRHDEGVRQALEGEGLVFARLEEAVLGTRGPPLRLEEPLELGTPTEQMDVARILDAAANRAREALRVVEDYCRFALDDAFLTGELKRLRHDLTAALADLGPVSDHGLAARDTAGDVGTTLSTAAEETRHSPLAVLQANLKRLQEALRTLEEFGKLHGPGRGRALEALRYRSYTLEKALLTGADGRRRLADARLYVLLTAAQCACGLEWTVREAAAGGAQVIQLREKGLDDRALLQRARQVRAWTREAGVLFILNDRPDLARLAEADGVHLGQDDLPVREARRIVGAEALVGVSTHDLGQLRQAVLDGAGYVGVGPTFPSGTKDFAHLAGLDYVRQATAETSLPAFVIGGVNLSTVASAVAAGARRVAVSGAIARAENPRQVAAQLRRLLDGA